MSRTEVFNPQTEISELNREIAELKNRVKWLEETKTDSKSYHDWPSRSVPGLPPDSFPFPYLYSPSIPKFPEFWMQGTALPEQANEAWKSIS